MSLFTAGYALVWRLARGFLLPALILSACGRKCIEGGSGAELLKVGELTVRASDLDWELNDRGISAQSEVIRSQELKRLGQRAQLAAAAIDAGLLQDSAIRVEVARLLASRYQELRWNPQFKAIAGPLPQEELRALYQANAARYQSPELRRAAVLWLNPGADERRREAYVGRLKEARQWYQGQAELKKNPAEGFSVLGVDYSEHQASRFKGGVLGWMARENAAGDAFTRAVAEIAFALKQEGEVSEVISRPEGVFMVRLVGIKAALQKPFEEVAAELERQALAERKAKLQEQLSRELTSQYPLEQAAGAVEQRAP